MADGDGLQSSSEAPKNQATRVILASALAVVLAVIGQVALEHPPGWLGFSQQLAHMLLDAAIIAAIGTGIAETPWFKGHMEQRLLRSALITKWTDPESLRQFTPHTLRAIARATQAACLPIPAPHELSELIDAMDHIRNNLLVWRTNYRVTITYTPTPGRADHYDLVVEHRYEFVNYCGHEKTFPQPFRGAGHAIPDTSDVTEFHLLELMVNGTSYRDNPVQPEHKGERTTWLVSVPVTLPPEGSDKPRVTVFIKAQERCPTHNPWLLTFYLPVHGLELKIHHPESVWPRMYLFGIGGNAESTDPMPPLDARPTYHEWRYRGWMVPSHGVVVNFSTSTANSRAYNG